MISAARPRLACWLVAVKVFSGQASTPGGINLSNFRADFIARFVARAGNAPTPLNP
jgi:hypothetical protein